MVKYEWYLNDTEEVFNEHYKKWPELFQPYVDRPVEYIFNDAGFRMKFEMDPDKSKKVDIYLGCSHTYGAGHYWENTWPYLVSQFTGNEIVNLGKGGHGSESSYYNLIRYFECFDVQNVFYFQDIVPRYDYFDKYGFAQPFCPQWYQTEEATPYKDWYISGALVEDWHIVYNHTKNVNAMIGFLKDKNVPFYHITEWPLDWSPDHASTDWYRAMTPGSSPLINGPVIADIDKDWYEENCKKLLIARDGSHKIALTLKEIADKFIKAVKSHKYRGYEESTPHMAKIFQKFSQ